MKVGSIIRKYRKKAGLSLNDVEEMCGIGKARLSRYENDWVQPNLDSIEVLAECFGVAPKRLVGWE